MCLPAFWDMSCIPKAAFFASFKSPQQNSIHLEYGLERYYVREGTGNPRGKLTVQAAMPSSGNAVIQQVFMDGKPYWR